MGVPARLAGFAVALVAVFALAFGAGRAMGDGAEPSDVQDRTTVPHDSHEQEG